ncbi:MAG: hypothetical protein ABR543_04190 [Gemmatimonadaceae bacterium]
MGPIMRFSKKAAETQRHSKVTIENLQRDVAVVFQVTSKISRRHSPAAQLAL